ncbi:MAG TPA: SGNH/GDSL hydrolase family protein [Rhodospirillales bacterium]|nr:SGNH/GDSL hydrolase family protein [Rhodospirillales bacterium]
MRLKTIIPNLVIVFIAGVFVSFLLLNISNKKYYTDSGVDIFIHFILPVLLVLLALSALRLSQDSRLVIANVFFAFVMAVYGAEWYLTATLESSKTGADGGVGDTRSKIQVIEDLRAKGVNAYPAMRALSLLVDGDDGQVTSDLQSGGAPLLPLGGIAEKTVVSCNESGRWMIYRTDRHGFNNPPQAWDSSPLQIGMIGDSFTHGNCVPPEKNMAAVLRKRFGGVVNLGISGNGPLIELGALKEYLVPLKPQTVLWFFFEGNDITENTPYERRSPLLMSYLLNDGFSQNLMARAGEISNLYKGYLDKYMVKAINRTVTPYVKFMDFLQIYNLRRRLGLNIVSLGVFEGATEEDYKLFAAVLKKAKTLVESWGGRFYFVYLPESDRYFGVTPNNRIRERIHSRMMEMVSGLEIERIDVSEVFAAAPDARTYFFFPGSHYNERGYEAAANAVVAVIKNGPSDRSGGPISLKIP